MISWPQPNIRRRRAQPGAGLWFLAAALLFATPIIAAQPSFKVSLDRDTIVAGETVVLTLTFEGVTPPGMPALPPIPGLQRAGTVGSRMNSTLGPDGTMTSSVAYTVGLVAPAAGEYTIPAMALEVGGQKLQSEPLKLKVLKEDPATPAGQSGDKLAFLSLELPKKDLYVGQVLPIDLRLYIRGDVRNISDAQIPPVRGEGFTSGQLVSGRQFAQTVGNNQYTVFPISTVITPVKSGQLTLNALNGSVVVHLPKPPSGDPIENFFGGSTKAQQIPLSLEAREMNVLPLPKENAPPTFTGAVGNYTMNFSAGPTNVAAGDPVTVKVQISGRGNFDAVTLPEQTAWRDFKAYPPKVETKMQDQLGIQGTKYFEQLIVPQNSDIKELPGVVFSFFDPDRKTYQTLSQPPVKLTVKPASSAAAPSVVTSRQDQENAPPSQDIVPIKERLGSVAQASPPLVLQPWFLGLQAIPFIVWVATVIWRRRTDEVANNPRLRRKRMVSQILREGIASLNRFASEKKSDDFFATLFRLLQEKLGQILDVPASAITEAVIEEDLRPRGVAETTLSQLQELFQACNLARYAPIRSSQELAALIPKLETVLRELEEIK